MSFKIVTVAPFRKAAKKLIKKYSSLKSELAVLGQKLSIDPISGVSLGNNCYKIHLAIHSKGKGKSGGARVITHFYIAENTVFLLSIYDKSETASISDKELQELLQFIP